MSAYIRPRSLAFLVAAISLALSFIVIGRADDKPQSSTVSADVVALLLRDGQGALANERFSEALGRFSEILRMDWNHPRAYELLQQTRFERDRALLQWEADARAAESRRDPSTAKWIYERILSEDSTRADLRDRLARLGRQHEAADYLRSGMEKFIADDFVGAQLDFEQTLVVNPRDTLAAQYRERARQKIAASGSLAAIQSDAAAWTRYLDALRKLRDGDLVSAERIWNDLLIIFPGNESIRSNLDQVRRRLGRENAMVTDE